ncbi:unnamed protein product [Prunus brigantina]
MSSHEQALIALVSQLALSFDGAILGVALAYAAVRTVLKLNSVSSALRKLHNAPSVQVSDLLSILSLDHSDESQPSDAKLVVVRGTVEAKSAVDGNWNILNSGVLVSQGTKERAVVLQRTQTCVYNEWKGFVGWPSDLRAIFSRSWRERESKVFRTVPFILAEGGRRPISEFVAVDMDGSRHPLPLTTVYHHLHPVNPSPYTFLEALFGHRYPVGLLDEEKILPLGKEISAVGLCSVKDGVLEIKSCKDFPYFLSEMPKDQMVVDLTSRTKVLFWSGIFLGSVSIGVLAYAVSRNWNRWKVWRQQRELQRSVRASNAEAQIQEEEEEEDAGDVPDGQLCVICLMRRRRSAFIPCGHLVCCQLCSISIERDVAPKCPVCRQQIRTSVRIYDS